MAYEWHASVLTHFVCYQNAFFCFLRVIYVHLGFCNEYFYMQIG